MGYSWVIDESYMSLRWVTNVSHMSHTLITLSNTIFLIFFFQLINVWPRLYLATLRICKMVIIFGQSEESNLVVRLTTLLWRVTKCFFVHRRVRYFQKKTKRSVRKINLDKFLVKFVVFYLRKFWEFVKKIFKKF